MAASWVRNQGFFYFTFLPSLTCDFHLTLHDACFSTCHRIYIPARKGKASPLLVKAGSGNYIPQCLFMFLWLYLFVRESKKYNLKFLKSYSTIEERRVTMGGQQESHPHSNSLGVVTVIQIFLIPSVVV